MSKKKDEIKEVWDMAYALGIDTGRKQAFEEVLMKMKSYKSQSAYFIRVIDYIETKLKEIDK